MAVKYNNIESPLTDKTSPFYCEMDTANKAKHLFGRKLRSLKKNDKRFKHARYIVIVKLSQSEHIFRIRGRPRHTKNYAIAILTSDNHYYFNTYTSKATYLTTQNVKELSYILTKGYIYDENTEILYCDDLKYYSEPVVIFLNTIASVIPIQISKRTFYEQLRTLNNFFKYIKPENGKLYRVHYPTLIRKMIKYNRFDFIPNNEFEVMRKLMTPNEWKMKLKCAIGILFLHIKNIKYNNEKNSRNRRKEKELKQQINEISSSTT